MKAREVRRLVDVRATPHSPALLSARLHYTYMPGPGGFRHARPDSINAGRHNASFRGFTDYMQTAEFRDNPDK